MQMHQMGRAVAFAAFPGLVLPCFFNGPFFCPLVMAGVMGKEKGAGKNGKKIF